MGACDFSNKVIIKGDARAAFRDAVEDANYENGHQQGYSGDIQCAHGFNMRTDNPRYGTQAFQAWEEKLLEQMDKGDCYCVELKGAVLKRHKDRTYLKGKKGVRGFYFFGMARC